MKRLLQSAGAAALLLGCAGAASADLPNYNDDYNYTRLARWEQHLDQRIGQEVSSQALRPWQAWRVQKQLDSLELRTVEAYHNSNEGIDDGTFRNIAGQLMGIGRQLGERGWNDQQAGGYGGGYAPPPPPNGGGYAPPPPNDGGYGPPPPPSGNYYREGQYESDCHRGNVAAGTVFGAVAGGLIGGAASHGNGGAIAGGVVLGGLLGNTLSRDIDCDDQHDAFVSFNAGLGGPVGQPYEWHHNGHHGTFVVIREYRDGDRVCRDFHTVNYRGDERFERDGTACRQEDGYWHFR